MTPEFKTQCEAKLTEFRQVIWNTAISSYRLVHYAGAGAPNGKDVSVNDIEGEIAGCLAEGLLVGWYIQGARFFLYAQEPGCPIPSLEKVAAEQALIDVDAILNGVGLGGA